MSPRNPEHEFNPKLRESERTAFADKFRDLLPGVEFEEPSGLLEARTAVLEALTRKDRGADFIQSVWIEYAKICEQIVDSKTKANPQIRAQLQIAMLVHKALIFREVGDVPRYNEDLSDAECYALNMHLGEIAETIGAELDELTS